MKLNKKGFTLIELIATILILGIVASIGTYSITSIIKSSRQKNYELLVENIKTAAEDYLQECRYVGKYDNCTGDNVNITIKLGKLIDDGYLTSNKTKGDNSKLLNPKNNESIEDCQIKITMVEYKAVISNVSTSDPNCPTSEHYKGNFND